MMYALSWLDYRLGDRWIGFRLRASASFPNFPKRPDGLRDTLNGHDSVSCPECQLSKFRQSVATRPPPHMPLRGVL